MTFGLLVQVLVSGLAAGATYGLVAIGFGLVYRLTSVLHFAHAELAGGAAFLALAIAAGSNPISETSVSPLRFRIAVGLSIIVVAGASALIYRVIIRPSLRDGSTLAWIGASVALALAIEGVLSLAFPKEAYVLPDVLFVHGSISLGGGAVLATRTLLVLVITLAIGVGTSALLRVTKYGKALSAIADEPVGAQATGLPVQPLITSAFAIAGALAAIAGAVAFPASAISAQTGAIFGLKGFAAALLAKLGSPKRILAWSLALGVFETAIVTLHIGLGPAWHDVGPLLLALAVLAFRRKGWAEDRME